MAEMVPNEVKAERSRLLREEALAGVERLRARHAGAPSWIAWESEVNGVSRGLTDTNVRVYGPAGSATPGELSHVRLTHTYRDGLWSDSLRAEIPLLALS